MRKEHNSKLSVCSSDGKYTILQDFWERLRGRGLRATLVRGVTGSLAVQILGSGIGFAAQVVLARLLGVTHYGIFLFVFSCTHILAKVSNLGFDTSLVRFVPQYKTNAEWGLLQGLRRRSFQYVAFNSGCFASVGLAIAWWFPEVLGTQRVPAFIIAFAGLPFLASMLGQRGILLGLKNVVLASIPQAVLRPVLLLLGVGIVYSLIDDLHFTASVVTAINFWGVGITFVVILIFVAKAQPSACKDIIQPQYADEEWVRTSLPMLFVSIMVLLSRQTALIMVGMLSGDAQAGIFGAANRIATLVTFGTGAVEMILAPMISELYHANKRAQLQRLLKMGAWLIFGFTAIVGVGFIFGGKFVLLLLGDRFIEGTWPLAVLVGGQIIFSLSGSVGFIMVMTGHQRADALIVAGALLIIILMSWLLIPTLGAMGGAVATTAGITFWRLSEVVFVMVKLRLNPTIVPWTMEKKFGT